MRTSLTGLGILFISVPVFAATPVDLSHQSASFLKSRAFTTSMMQLDEANRSTDFNNTLHVRVKQTYQGYPVWGGDAVVHVPQAGHSKKALSGALTESSTMNGIVYQDLNQDLASTPKEIFNDAQKQKAIAQAIALYQSKMNKPVDINDQNAKLMVYLDKNNKAHWAFHVSFLASQAGVLPEKPAYLLDAMNLSVYQQWNDMKTLDKAEAGGFGGNHKTGQKIFDGLDGHLPKLDVTLSAGRCQMKNDDVTIKDTRTRSIVAFDCKITDPEHNNIYWNGSFDKIETTWSPSNDALFGSMVTSNMYKSWYGIPMLVKNGKPMMLPITVHESFENAYWDGQKVVFGDSIGSDMFNPFTSLDTVAHEISHGFTEQHSGLEYYSQSGGLNEAYSDMAGIAAEYYAYGKTDFLVGWGDMKAEGKALRYMEQPSRDCEGNTPGYGCSIDNMSQYRDNLDPHYSSGIFNRVYYLLANSADWNPKKAFDVMVQANRHYWTATSTFDQAACGVVSAAKDYKYDLDTVYKAFDTVGVNAKKCKTA